MDYKDLPTTSLRTLFWTGGDNSEPSISQGWIRLPSPWCDIAHWHVLELVCHDVSNCSACRLLLEPLTLCTVRHTMLSLHAPFFKSLVKSLNEISPIANAGDHNWGTFIMAKWPLCTVLCCSLIFSHPLFIDMNKTEIIPQTRVYFHVNILI